MGAALRFAAAAGKTDIVRVLIARRADLEESDVFGKTAIVHAAANGHVECVRLLLNAGAAQHGRALQMAALCGQDSVVDYLLSCGVRPGLAPEYALMSDNPHAGLLALRKPDADVALGLAVQLDYPQAVQRLIAAGANVNRPNFFPLHESFESDVLKVLVEAGADANRKNKDGLTPLEYHLKNGTIRVYVKIKS
jgi:ankyrin repeat protein